ncbi:MAG: tRNA (N6-threonylcarbamoyladenosine(37)-N6)-methyltransferase TrmO [Anaerolineae bacterium]|nr:tRNA (N6-threonylcarbamoyladenosine(37)-N6)-methyltransferase TrmO [Anaerolineae bacterium]
MSHTIQLTPIGFIRSQFSQNTLPEIMRQETSQIVIEPEFEPGLMGLEPGQDIQVFFYFSKIQADEIHLQLHPRHDPANPLKGVFATRTQFRPNQIGATVARIEQIEANVITVTGLDGQDGTPVLDIKPYTPHFDAATDRQPFEVSQVNGLEEARAKIDRLDGEIIRLLGHRAAFVHQVTRFKRHVDEAPAPQRYAAVMASRRQMAEAAGLNPDVIEAMYTLLIDHFIKEEVAIIQRREGLDG